MFPYNMETKRILKYKFIHRIIPTNKRLYAIKIKDSNKCNRCSDIDTIKHSFYDHESSIDFGGHFKKGGILFLVI